MAHEGSAGSTVSVHACACMRRERPSCQIASYRKPPRPRPQPLAYMLTLFNVTLRCNEGSQHVDSNHSNNSHIDSPSSDNIICTVGVAIYAYSLRYKFCNMQKFLVVLTCTKQP